MLASGLPCAYIYNNNNNNNNNNNRGQVTIKCDVIIIQCELFNFFIY
jgi:hypothetical protein